MFRIFKREKIFNVIERIEQKKPFILNNIARAHKAKDCNREACFQAQIDLIEEILDGKG